MSQNSNSRLVEQHRLDGVLDVTDRPHAIIAVGDNRRDVPSVDLHDAKLSGVQKWLAEAQVGRIERVGQTRRRQMIVDAGVELLRDRLAAVVTAHRELLGPALEEIRLLADAFSRRIHRDAELREQRVVSADILRSYQQYHEAVTAVPDDVDGETRQFLLTTFGDQFFQTVANIETGMFGGRPKKPD